MVKVYPCFIGLTVRAHTIAFEGFLFVFNSACSLHWCQAMPYLAPLYHWVCWFELWWVLLPDWKLVFGGTYMFATAVLLSSPAPWGVHLLATKMTIGHRSLRAAALLAVWWSCPAVNRDRLSTLLPRCTPEHMIWSTETWQMLLNGFQMVPRVGTVQGANTLAQFFGLLSGNYL